MDIIKVDMSAPQETKVGKALADLYYRNTALLEMAPGRSGYPHNGGQHTFRLEGPRKEVLAWIELFTEAYSDIRRPVSWLYQDISGLKTVKSFNLAAKYAC